MNNVKKNIQECENSAQLFLAFPCLEDPNEKEQHTNIVPFIRKNPKYIFPYRICKDFEDSGDAA